MRAAGIGSMMGLMMFIAGCPGVQPGPEAVLEGVWKAETGENVELTVTFDSNGVVVQVKGELENGATATASPSGATTTLDGSAVTIVIPTGDGEVTFDGTLSDDENTMTGTLDRSINIGQNTVVTVPAGELTLHREDDDGNGGDPCENVTCDPGSSCVEGECVPDQPEACADADATAGGTYFAANCAACHGADATGGFGPNIQCESAAEITAAMSGIAIHASLTPTAADICDLEAYLNSFDACSAGPQ